MVFPCNPLVLSSFLVSCYANLGPLAPDPNASVSGPALLSFCKVLTSVEISSEFPKMSHISGSRERQKISLAADLKSPKNEIITLIIWT